jgi:hypothetical protein
MKQAHLTVTEMLTPTWTLTLIEDVTKTSKGEPCSYLVMATGHFECWWYPFFPAGTSGLRIKEVPHVNKDSTQVTVFLLFFMD